MVDETENVTKEEPKEKQTVWTSKKYLGKELKKEDQKNTPPKWKLFRLKFESETEYPFTIDAFNTMGTKEGSNGLEIKNMEEGNYYSIGYNLIKDAFEAHGKWHDNRTAFFVKEITLEEYEKAKKETSTENKTPTSRQSTTSSGSGGVLSKDQIDELYVKLQKFDIAFQKKLADAGREDDYTKEQFVASAYIYLHKDEARTVLAYWNASNNESSIKEEDKDEEKKPVVEKENNDSPQIEEEFVE